MSVKAKLRFIDADDIYGRIIGVNSGKETRNETWDKNAIWIRNSKLDKFW